ncbi:MAG: ion transporter [Proteobacteria bacterium]|nr:ion transporter [Pseudomonadota bacterium]
MSAIRNVMKRTAESKWFQRTITVVILLAGALVGMETDPGLVERHQTLLHVLDQIIIWIFVAEMLVKMAAEGRRPWRYFLDPWNVFDFLIVATCFMPINAQYVMVLRLARLLRVLKLVRVLPKLQILVSALLKSIPSMGYVGLLLAILFYVYGVAATLLFAGNDPMHFGSLGMSILSLFGVVTMEGWVTIMDTNRLGCDRFGYEGFESLCVAPEAFPIASPLLFITLILFGTMIILNLFIGVIMNGMESAREEADLAASERRRKEAGEGAVPVSDAMSTLLRDMDELQGKMKRLQYSVKQQETARTERPRADG